VTIDFSHETRPSRVVFAAGARFRLVEEVERLGATRVLLVASDAEAALADEVEKILDGRVVGRFRDVVQHVPVPQAEAARALARSTGADATLTVGGGSATGLGKAVSLELPIPQIALPTTYAGSEMTPIWGMSDGSRKWTGRDDRVQPRVVVYDPELTLTLPPRIAGPSGMNAMAHCVEALYGPGTNPLVSLTALEGARALHEGLPAVCRRPEDLDARAAVLLGAYLAGAALADAGTALHHKACHVLGGRYGLDHADMNAVVLPHALAYNRPAIPREYARLGEVLGGDPVDALVALVAAIGAPASLEAIGMPEAGVSEAAPDIVAAAAGNVREPDVESIRAMLDDAWHGRRPAAGP
jgi:maleylacetate reductase